MECGSSAQSSPRTPTRSVSPTGDSFQTPPVRRLSQQNDLKRQRDAAQEEHNMSFPQDAGSSRTKRNLSQTFKELGNQKKSKDLMMDVYNDFDENHAELGCNENEYKEISDSLVKLIPRDNADDIESQFRNVTSHDITMICERIFENAAKRAADNAVDNLETIKSKQSDFLKKIKDVFESGFTQ